MDRSPPTAMTMQSESDHSGSKPTTQAPAVSSRIAKVVVHKPRVVRESILQGVSKIDAISLPAAPWDVIEAVATRSNLCAVPGCGVELSRWAKTGVCRQHNHARGFCQCMRCRGLRQ